LPTQVSANAAPRLLTGFLQFPNEWVLQKGYVDHSEHPQFDPLRTHHVEHGVFLSAAARIKDGTVLGVQLLEFGT
jgi:hypothetical protein